jgi:hypothetical protein
VNAKNLKNLSDWFGSDFDEIKIEPDEAKSASLSMLYVAVQLAMADAGASAVAETISKAQSNAWKSP